MTCEIAIMNLNAVTLAADSAMTVTQWVNGEKQSRYFKGSNKIFQLSSTHPVGLMVYGSAGMQGVPWELMVKEFRTHLKSTSYDSLSGYAEALFDYIRQHPALFPLSRRKELFLDQVQNLAIAHLRRMGAQLTLSSAPATEDEKKKVIDDYLQDEITKELAVALPNNFKPDTDTKALTDNQAELATRLNSIINWMKSEKEIHADRNVDASLVAKFAVLTLYRKYSMVLPNSGIVVAGYGEHDLYPGYFEFACYGFLLDDMVFDEVGSASATLTSKSVIKPFATTAMVDTFLLGFSEDVFELVKTKHEMAVRNLLEEVKKELNAADIPNIDTHLTKSFDDYQSSWTNAVADNHYRPLRDVVASLPVDEMANLASTLVMLQSLKEKVTSPTESVGGPIDVAVITKHEGLIWIKRKHYFDRENNPRYFMRQQN